MIEEDDEAMMIVEGSTRLCLKSVRELAKGITYTEPLCTGWKPRRRRRGILMAKEASDIIRKRLLITADGEDVPPPIDNFKDMLFPHQQPILRKLKEKGVVQPTPIQIQGLPVVLSGRDMIGIAPTGSGKTLVFVLPLVMMALQEEIMMPIGPGEGPFGLIICPSRELARQTYLEVQLFLQSMTTTTTAGAGAGAGYPNLRSLLCTGGMDIKSQLQQVVKKKGVHIVVATPGRLKDLLAKKILNLDTCRYLTLDEADRLLDQRFQDDIKDILDHFKDQRQTVLFSATMPKRTQDFAAIAMVKPVIVSVGKAGSPNLDVIQQVEYVEQGSSKNIHLLECLGKTPPPVIVFCQSKAVVDQVHEYLVIKGVDAVAIHGDKDQEDRVHAIKSFKEGKADVLVATDVVSKGLDFTAGRRHIEHVINYDMPDEIDDYVHRIGRTGRCGRTGIATTFINNTQSPTILLDLKHILLKAKQKVPLFLQQLKNATTTGSVGVHGCTHCGGLGHGVQDCPRSQREMKKQIACLKRDYYSFTTGCCTEM